MTTDPLQYARRWKTLAVLSLSLVIIGLDNTILNVALPTLQHEFDASPSELQWMVDSYLLLVFGVLGDRFGRKRALQAGISIFGLASLGALVADSADQVMAVRAAMGVGAALIMPATLSIIANLFTGKERRKAIAIWAALAAIGIGLGPLRGPPGVVRLAVGVHGQRVRGAAFLLGIRYVPERARPRPGRSTCLSRALHGLQPPRVRDHRGPGRADQSHRRTFARPSPARRLPVVGVASRADARPPLLP
jgi:MFS family permease